MTGPCLIDSSITKGRSAFSEVIRGLDDDRVLGKYSSWYDEEIERTYGLWSVHFCLTSPVFDEYEYRDYL